VSRSLTLDLTSGATLRGPGSALALTTGTMTVLGGILDQDTAAPTLSLSAGAAILQGVTLLESSGGNHSCVQIQGGTLDLSSFGGNTLRVRGPGGMLIDNNAVTGVNVIGATPNTWSEDAVTFNPAVLADNFSIEDRVLHALDASTRGLVRWRASNVYVTQNSGSIQRGVDAAAAGNTVNVNIGTFAGQVIITKSLTVLGAQRGQDADVRFAAFTGGKASPAVESVLTAANNAPSTGNPNAEDLVRVLANNITLDGLVLDGNNPALGASTLQIAGVDIHARRGIANVSATDVVTPVDNLLRPGSGSCWNRPPGSPCRASASACRRDPPRRRNDRRSRAG
jgi:hypothetical protein